MLNNSSDAHHYPPFFPPDYQRQRQHLIRMENYKLAVFPVTLSLNPFKKIN